MYNGGDHYDGNGGGAANANSLFSGGGFMPSQTTNAPEGSGGITKVCLSRNPAQSPIVLFLTPKSDSHFPFVGSPCAQTRGAQTLLPLTVKQIMDASQTNDDKSSFAVNGTEVSTVRILPLRPGLFFFEHLFTRCLITL